MCFTTTTELSKNLSYIETPFYTKHGDFIGFYKDDSPFLSDRGDTLFHLSSYGCELNKTNLNAIKETVKHLNVKLDANLNFTAESGNEMGIVQAMISVCSLEPLLVKNHLFDLRDDAKKQAEMAIEKAAIEAGYKVTRNEYVVVMGRKIRMSMGLHTQNNQHQVYAETIIDPANNANSLNSVLTKMSALKSAGYTDKSRMAFFTGKADTFSLKLLNDVSMLYPTDKAEVAFSA
jgi:hypothetical protein